MLMTLLGALQVPIPSKTISLIYITENWDKNKSPARWTWLVGGGEETANSGSFNKKGLFSTVTIYFFDHKNHLVKKA